MATFKIKVKNQVEINKKPRVYFTCHPDDFEKYFEKICEDIFRTHDCAIYYTEDMIDIIAEDEKEVDLGRNNLFVVPITYKLLSTPNRAMDEDISYAFEHHIPVLPIMMESGIDMLYSRPDKFGELQYLNPFSTDLTEISYEDKLEKHLESILISNEMAERVRAAFDAHVFLSYRKKDRKYANELMRLVHSNPACRDIAIWFDEFLTPGESFRENIDKILKDSKLFTLLVTPNLLEEPDGKPNFVMGEEFPAARDLGINILPAEMVETDKKALGEKFKGIPQCVNPNDDEFYNQFLDSIEKIATEANNTPEHNFLIGLAYLDGIDVEVNREIALELITDAGHRGLPQAMQKLYHMYDEGIGVELNYRRAAVWGDRYAMHLLVTLGEGHIDTLSAFNELVITYIKQGKYQKAFELSEMLYTFSCKTFGEEHPDTLPFMYILAYTYELSGNYQKALELNERLYAIRCKTLGEEHPDTLASLNSVIGSCSRSGNHEKAIELSEKAYQLFCEILGEEHPDTLTTLNNFAYSYDGLGNYEKALELYERVYEARCKVIGENNPDTLSTLSNIASMYYELKDYEKALEINKNVLAVRCRLLGEEHPDSIISLNNIACNYSKLGEYEKILELQEEIYTLSCRGLGEEHPNSLTALNNLAHTYRELGDYQKSLKLYEKTYANRCKVLGEENPVTLTTLVYLAYIYGKLNDYKKALELNEKAYTLRSKVLGEEHNSTISTLSNVAVCYKELGDLATALSLNERVYNSRVKVLGVNHSQTIKSRDRMEEIKKLLSEESK